MRGTRLSAKVERKMAYCSGVLCCTGFPCPLPSWTLPGRAPKAPGTPPAADRPKGKRQSPDQAAMRMSHAALKKLQSVTALQFPSNALVALNPGVTGTVMPAIPSGLRVKRKYTKRKSGTPVATALWRGNAAVAAPLGAAGQQALVVAGDAHAVAAKAPGQAVMFGSTVEDGAAALRDQPALEAASMQVGDASACSGVHKAL